MHMDMYSKYMTVQVYDSCKYSNILFKTNMCIYICIYIYMQLSIIDKNILYRRVCTGDRTEVNLVEVL